MPPFKIRPVRMEETNINLQGSLLCVFGVGVLITGRPGIGKSELSLALINRGHQFIADDAPSFNLINGQIVGFNTLLKPILHIRGLGFLDVNALFGPSAFHSSVVLKLIIQLEECLNPPPPVLEAFTMTKDLLGCLIPCQTIPIITPRQLEILVEVIVKKYLIITAQCNYREPLPSDREPVCS